MGRGGPQQVLDLLVGEGQRAIADLTDALHAVLAEPASVTVTARDGSRRSAGPQATASSLARLVGSGHQISFPARALRGNPLTALAQLATATAREVRYGTIGWRRDPAVGWKQVDLPRRARPAPPVSLVPTSSTAAAIPPADQVIVLGHPRDVPAAPLAVSALLATLPKPSTTASTLVSLPPLAALTCANRAHYQEALLRLNEEQSRGRQLTSDEEAWCAAYRRLAHAATPQAVAPFQVPNAATDALVAPATAKDEQKAANRALFEAAKAKQSNRERRSAALETLQALIGAGVELTERQLSQLVKLEAADERDRRDQRRIDREFDAAVVERARLVTTARRSRPLNAPVPVIPGPVHTAKGAFLLFPKGIDPHDVAAMADWMQRGFNLRRSKVQSSLVDLQVACPEGSSTDRVWMQYVARRICWAIGRDPDHDVVVASHEPALHPPSKVDGKPIHPHFHMAIRVCSDDGTTWRCPNIHLVIQRELEAINCARGWQLTTSSAAKGRQAQWYAPGSKKMGWTLDGVFSAADSPEAVARVAAEPVPSDPWSRPSAGIVIVNAQFSERRKALREADERAFVAASAQVEDLLRQVERAGITLTCDERGGLLLRYFSGTSTQPRSPRDQLLADLARAVVVRDCHACSVIVHRLLYYSQ